MNRLCKLIGTAALSLSLIGCSAEEKIKYENEDAKLREYTINIARAIEDGMNSVEKSGDPERFVEVAEPYMSAFKDIRVERLSDESKFIYEMLNEGLYPYNSLVSGSGATLAGYHSKVEDSVIGVSDFVTVAKQQYEETDDSSDYKELDDF